MDKPNAVERPSTESDLQKEDREWIHQTLNGNPEAFGKLVERHKPLIGSQDKP